MKIESRGPIRSSPAKKGEKSAKAGSAGQFVRHLKEGGDSTSSVSAAVPVHSVDSVLAIQNVGDATDNGEKAKAKQWGLDTLDQLEQIRIDLLMGAIPKGRLMNLARIVQARREKTNDPYLNGLLDEIELRVRVEIAKYEPRT